MTEQTRGEALVVLSHSTDEALPVGEPRRDAADVKQMAADLIDLIEARCPPGRWRSLAVTSVEEASMWAVKSRFNTEPPPAPRAS